jgi:uncharacterized protein
VPEQFSFIGGLLLGLTASLHCAGMCGPLVISLLHAARPQGATEGSVSLAVMQLGKAIGYIFAGACFGAFGSSVVALFDREGAYRILQWAGAVSLMWIGLSTLRVVPSPAIFDRLNQRFPAFSLAVSGAGARFGPEIPLLAGLLWGFMPCGMVYAALFTAMLTGSGPAGAIFMAGFALGTVPAVTSAAVAATSLRAWARSTIGRLIVGFMLTALGPLSLLLSAPGGPLCITR